MAGDLLSVIEQNLETYSKGQRLLGAYILENYDKAAFMTASRLGTAVGTSESTVVRFAMELGFDGYPELQAQLQMLIRNRLTSVQRLEVADVRLSGGNIVSSVLHSDIDKIKQTLEELDKDAFERAVNAIISAEKIYILGVRSSAALAGFLGFYFNLMFDNVRLVHTSSVSEMFEQILKVGKNDVVVGISFPRYSKRTVQALKYSRDKGAYVLAITDSKTSPIAKFATNVLTARSDMASFVDSLVAPLSLINALIAALTLNKKQEITRSFTELENIWDEYNVYEKPEE